MIAKREATRTSENYPILENLNGLHASLLKRNGGPFRDSATLSDFWIAGVKSQLACRRADLCTTVCGFCGIAFHV